MATNSKILLYGLGKTNRALFDKLKFYDHLYVGSDYESDLLYIDKKYHWDSDLVSLDDWCNIHTASAVDREFADLSWHNKCCFGIHHHPGP